MNELDKKVGWGPFNKDELGTQQREIYVCTFSLLAILVGSDGDLSKEELHLISQLIKQTLKLDDQKRVFVQSVFNETKRCNVDFIEMVNRYKTSLSAKPEMYQWLMDVLVRLALADGVYTDEEHELLKLACKTLGLSEDRINKVASAHGKTNIAEFYKILGLANGSSLEEVELAYEKLMAQYDVKKIVELGLAKELIDIASERQGVFMQAFLGIKSGSK